jgi:hypothetical protein
MSDDLVSKLLDVLSPEQKQLLLDSLERDETKNEPEQKPVQKVDDQFAEFSMNKVNDKQPRPVEVKKRLNEFVDDGTEHSDVVTPKTSVSERRRPAFKKVDQTCTRCSKVKQVHPQHAREFYVCDRCLRR